MDCLRDAPFFLTTAGRKSWSGKADREYALVNSHCFITQCEQWSTPSVAFPNQPAKILQFISAIIEKTSWRTLASHTSKKLVRTAGKSTRGSDTLFEKPLSCKWDNWQPPPFLQTNFDRFRCGALDRVVGVNQPEFEPANWIVDIPVSLLQNGCFLINRTITPTAKRSMNSEWMHMMDTSAEPWFRSRRILVYRHNSSAETDTVHHCSLIAVPY